MSAYPKHDWVLKLAFITAQRSTCVRRSVGCVLTDDAGVPIGMGYNGVPSGLTHCKSRHGEPATPCPGADLPSGEGLDECFAIHAEQNALLFCASVRRIAACYVTVSPCMSCVKSLLNTPCKLIVVAAQYENPEGHRAKALWLSCGRIWLDRGGAHETLPSL